MWAAGGERPLTVFALDVTPRHLVSAIDAAGGAVRAVRALEEADVVVTPAVARRRSRKLVGAIERRGLPVYTLRRDDRHECVAALRLAVLDRRLRHAA